PASATQPEQLVLSVPSLQSERFLKVARLSQPGNFQFLGNTRHIFLFRSGCIPSFLVGEVPVMWLRRLRRAYFGEIKTSPIVTRPRGATCRTRPVLELLEDRLAPAITVTTVSDDAMHTGTSLRDAIAQANTDAQNGTSDTIDLSGLSLGAHITLTQGVLDLS